MDLDATITLQTMTYGDAALRVLLACLFGLCLGFERSSKNKPVDFRVYMIVAATSCLVVMMGQEIQSMYEGQNAYIRLDIFRIIEGVLTGIGFLGAGAIIKNDTEQKVLGSATGASIWGAGGVGMMLGFGLYGLAILGFIALAVILVLFGLLRKPLFNEKEKYEKSRGGAESGDG